MIRKAIIAVLTLATVGTVIVIIISRPYSLDIGGNRSIFVVTKMSGIGVMYLTISDPSKPDMDRRWMGFGVKRFRLYLQPSQTYSRTAYATFFPSWFAVVVFGAYPLYAVMRFPARRRRRRRKNGLCVDCGYDLTGNVTGVCSECGTEIDSSTMPPTSD